MTRRVTIAEHTDEADRLRIIPDIVVTRREGRFMLRPNPSQGWMTTERPAISTLNVRLSVQPNQAAEREMRDHLLTELLQALESAWSAAEERHPREAAQLIP